MPTLEDRIDRLEESVFFQERLLADLNTALAAQQRQLDTLEDGLRIMRQNLEALRDQVGEGPANVPPPHYL